MSDFQYNKLTLLMCARLAAPHTWPGPSVLTTVFGGVFAASQGYAFDPLIWCVLLVCAVAAQSAVNTLNDWADYRAGTDTVENSDDPTDAVLVYEHPNPKHVLALGVGYAVGNVWLKELVMRPRPFVTHTDLTPLLDPGDRWSFPSGHALSSFAAATALFFFHKKTGLLAYLLAACIAFSRLYASVHYPTDVLAGAVLGILCGLAAAWFADRFTDQLRTLRLRKGRK